MRAAAAAVAAIAMVACAAGDRPTPQSAPAGKRPRTAKLAVARSKAPGSAPAARPSGDPLRPVASDQSLGDGTSYRMYAWSFPLRDAELDVVDLAFTTPMEGALAAAGASLVFNAGFFGVDGAAQGLAIARGRTISALSPPLGGGVLSTRARRASLHEAETFQLPSGTDFAIQCRPRLVVDGRANVRRDDGKRADRTALCIRDHGERLEMLIARTEDPTGMSGPTLHAFARTLERRGCEAALNLDGGPSTGAAWRDRGAVRVLDPRGPVRLAISVRVRGAAGR